MMVLVMSTGVMASSRREFVDGTLHAVKVARAVWSGGKCGNKKHALVVMTQGHARLIRISAHAYRHYSL